MVLSRKSKDRETLCRQYALCIQQLETQLQEARSGLSLLSGECNALSEQANDWRRKWELERAEWAQEKQTLIQKLMSHESKDPCHSDEEPQENQLILLLKQVDMNKLHIMELEEEIGRIRLYYEQSQHLLELCAERHSFVMTFMQNVKLTHSQERLDLLDTKRHLRSNSSSSNSRYYDVSPRQTQTKYSQGRSWAHSPAGIGIEAFTRITPSSGFSGIRKLTSKEIGLPFPLLHQSLSPIFDQNLELNEDEERDSFELTRSYSHHGDSRLPIGMDPKEWKAATMKTFNWMLKQAGKVPGIPTVNSSSPTYPKLTLNGRSLHFIRQIAEGRRSTVFLCQDDRHQEYAVKRTLIHSQAASTHKADLEYLNQLCHPNLIRILGSRSIPSGGKLVQLYTVMNKAEHSIQDMITTRREQRLPFSEPEVLRMANDVVSAMSCLHSQNPPMAHRDLRPENVLWFSSSSGIKGDGLYKLCGLGSCSRTAYELYSSREITIAEEEIHLVTMPGYRPPEMCELKIGTRIDQRVDIWGIGCLLASVILMNPPFDTAAQVIKGLDERKFKGNPCSHLSTVIMKCLKYDPNQRPDVFEVASILNQLQGLPSNINRPIQLFSQPVANLPTSQPSSPATFSSEESILENTLHISTLSE
eukprot:NODE_1103_length_2128_cov_33.334663_g933_i0.p1 GENE.NODE_1103_length_2128_cov_33.334663_g933_i0~~NODE_1103_length_2128_cov_33.334663_g933_i0.p1  ORF type:complete len:643 (-),score=117.76 NODE_1103_length_2128_cov_33.334663_g933_i0:91-2019(-)